MTADMFGVETKAVDVSLSDHNGLLALTITTPVPGATLNRTHHPDLATPTEGGNILQRVAQAHTVIRERVSALSGAEVAHVTIRVSGIETGEVRGVR